MPHNSLLLSSTLLCFVLTTSIACGSDSSDADPADQEQADVTVVDSDFSEELSDDAAADGDSNARATVESCLELQDGEPTALSSHRVQRATSDDGLEFTLDDAILLEAASVPDAVIRENGETWVYYVNGQPGQHSVFIARQTNTGGLESFDCIRIDDGIEPNAVDPDIVRLDDGRYRIFYFKGWFVGSAPPAADTPHPFYSAISDDGIHFELEGMIFEVDGGGTDPTAVQLADGSWLVAIAHPDGVTFYTSPDGIDYTPNGSRVGNGIPELAVLTDGTLRLYNAEREGWLIYDSPDGGVSWDNVGTLRLPGADPSLVTEHDGTYTLYFKSFGGEGQPTDIQIDWVSDFEPPTGRAHDDVERGPGARRLLSATSTDGLTFERTDSIISDQANVPDLVRVGDILYLYYTAETFGDRSNGSPVALSRDDGATWIYRYLDIEDWDGPVADPDIIHSPRDGFTLFFTGPGGIHRASGIDGINFDYDGLVLTYEEGPTWDSSTHNLPMGLVMYTLGESGSPGVHLTANSSDGGQNFEPIGEVTFNHEGRAVFSPNGLIVDIGVRMYGFSGRRDGGVVSFVTTDGENFRFDDGYRLQPSGDLEGDNLRGSAVVQLEDESFLMVYTADIP
jgi:hypothetical protein